MRSASTLFLLVLLTLKFSVHAQVVEEKMKWTPAPKVVALKKGPLALQKKFEVEKKWGDCVAVGQTNASKYSSIRGWVLISWLHCAREFSIEKKEAASLQAAINSAEGQNALLVTGPWKNTLWSELLKARFALVELNLKSQPAEAWQQVEVLIANEDRLEKSQKAKALMWAGELAQGKTQLKAAQFFYEQSLAEQDTKLARDKLSALLFALGEKKDAAEEKAKSDVPSDMEGNFEERFKNSVKSNDLLNLLEDCIAYLRQFPGGRRSKWAQEKVSDVYLGLLDQVQDEKVASLRDRALGVMEKADALRMLDWARQLHKKSDYRGSLRLAERALDQLGTSTSGAALLYMAGRSSQMLGDYKKAKKNFEQYIEQFSGGEDIAEVYFRLGLTFLRMGQASSAIASFEKLLLLKNGDRYELNARYWLARSFQATNNTRALTVVDEILAKYPLSYYGLRLRMERASGMMEWPTPLRLGKEVKGSYYLLTSQKKVLDRVQLLAQNGWTAEALWEVSDLPFPSDAVGKVLIARKFNEWLLFPPTIRLVNEATDLDTELRALDVISLSLPQVYKEIIQDQAAKQKLNPYLVRSLIRQESAFGPRAVSTSNAYGLMQLIGPTAAEVATELGLRGIAIPDDVFVPENNIQMGTYYIAKVIKQYNGHVPLGLAAYNAGPHRLKIFVDARKEVSDQMQKFSSDPLDEMWFDELPWYETSFYVKAILRNAILYQLADKSENKDPDQRRVQFGSVIWGNLVQTP
jgi:soluble lytic murein transglycosylase